MTRREAIGWQEAVARLAGERTRAETCAGLLKKHGDAAAISRGALAYGEAKAEVDALIAGLVTALAIGKKPTSLPDLEVQLKRGRHGAGAGYERRQGGTHCRAGAGRGADVDDRSGQGACFTLGGRGHPDPQDNPNPAGGGELA